MPESPDRPVMSTPVWRGGESPQGIGPTVVSIGVFDGVHRGHRAVLDRAVQEARERGVPLVVVTFDPHPALVARPGTVPPPSLGPVSHRVELLLGAGADGVWVLPFTTELSQLTPEDFVAVLDSQRSYLQTQSDVIGSEGRLLARYVAIWVVAGGL